MKILTQDRNAIANIDIVEAITVKIKNNKAYIVYRKNNTFYDMGSYETTIRAQEVLEDIFSHIMQNFRTYMMPL